jgi:hypothetical protein
MDIQVHVAHWFSMQACRFRQAVLGRVPLWLIQPLSRLCWRVRSLVSASVRADGEIRCEIAHAVLGLSKRQGWESRSASQLESLIDKRIYFGRSIAHRETFASLELAAQILAEKVACIRRENASRPVILSPFHYVSQYANIYVVEAVAKRLGIASMSVISGVPRDQYGNDDALIPGIDVLYTYGDGNRGGLGVRVARALKRDGVAVLFADVPPFTMHRYPMETVGVNLFGRPARIHNGAFRMGGAFGAVLLPFYLRLRRNRFQLHVFDSIDLASATAPQCLADDIEAALKDNYQQWTCAGHPAMYAFAPAK